MKPINVTVILCALLLHAGVTTGQVREESLIRRLERGKEVVRPEEVVSFKKDVLYVTALQSLSEMSKKFTGKPIVDPSPSKERTVGVNIESMYWRDALELMLRTNGFWYTEHPDYFQVVPLTPAAAAVTPVTPPTPGVPQPTPQVPFAAIPALPDSALILAKSREVMISAVFLEVNKTLLAESGVNFSLFRGRDLNLGVEFLGSAKVSSDIFSATLDPTSPRMAVNIRAALRFFESNGFGEIIARPEVTVRSGMPGRVQVGEDFSIKTRDFAGNLIDQFYSTGTILEVFPKIYTYEGVDFVDLGLSVERSSVTPDPVSIRVNKTSANSKLLLLDGEENYVGGLFINEERITREGVPLLKDLPWWILGLRYVFGYDKHEVIKKELIVLIKAELVPVLEERASQQEGRKNILDQKLQEGREEMKRRSQKDKN